MIAEKQVSYGAGRMDVYRASSDRAVLVWFHGGGLEGGCPEDYAFLAQPLEEAGASLVLPGYRFLPQAAWPACIEDAAQAVAAARRLFPGKKLLVGGSSAGAYLSMMLCFDGRYLEKEGMTPGNVDGWFFNAGQPTTHYNVLAHRGEDPRLCRLDEAAPLYFVKDAGPDAPICILCAEHDMTCRVTQNRLLEETLAHFGRPADLTDMEVLPGYEHCAYDGPTPERPASPLQERIIGWLSARFPG